MRIELWMTWNRDGEPYKFFKSRPSYYSVGWSGHTAGPVFWCEESEVPELLRFEAGGMGACKRVEMEIDFAGGCDCKTGQSTAIKRVGDVCPIARLLEDEFRTLAEQIASDNP